MLVQFVTVLPGVLGSALLVMAYSVLLSTGQGRKKPRSSYLRQLGLALGLLAALIFAGLRATALINRRTMVNQPTLFACVLVDLLALGLIIGAGRVVRNWQEHPRVLGLANAVAGLSIGLTVFRALPDVILHLTNFVEPGSPIFTSEMLMRALGFLLGIAAAVVMALIFRSLAKTCPPFSFTVASFLLLLLLLVQHTTALFALLQNSGDLVLHGTLFALMARFYNANTWLVIAQAAVFLLPALGSVVEGYRLPLTGPDPAQVRQHRAFRRRANLASAWGLVAVTGLTLALTAGLAQAYKEPVLSPPETYSLQTGQIAINFSQVSDGHLHRFEYQAKDGTTMRFIIIKKNGGAYGIGLDACENCGPAGYFERDGKIICKRCDVAINVATIGYRGGCNPIPFDYTTTQGKIHIQTATLDALSSVFQV